MSRAGCALLLLALSGLAPGCAVERAERLPRDVYADSGTVLYVGSLYDLRHPSSGARPTGEEAELDLVDQRELRVPVSEIRSVLADGLARAQLFTRVVSPPAAFAGETPDALLQNAQQSSDYLLVGEVNQFHIKSVGFNARGRISIPLDLLLSPIAFATYVTTAGNMYLFSGGLMRCWTAEVVLTMSMSVIDVASGRVAHTVRLAERVRSAYDGTDAFGQLWDDSDDWIDLGRRLGEVALHNAAVELAAELHARMTATGEADAPEPR